MQPKESDIGLEDTTARAGDVLESALSGELEAIVDPTVPADRVAPAEALRGQGVLTYESTRTSTRVLFVTADPAVLTGGSAPQQEFINAAGEFDEVHVCVMGARIPRRAKTERVTRNMWIYPVPTRSRLMAFWRVYTLIRSELFFGGAFRPDVVVSLDPFDAGVAGYVVARRFKRPFQLHIFENVFTEYYQKSDPDTKWHTRFSHWLLRHPLSVRTRTEATKQTIERTFKRIKDIAVLPQYYHIAEIMQQTVGRERTPRYPQFRFTFLFVGTLDADSTLFRTIDALRFLLRSPSIGLVVIGDGPMKAQFEERAKLFGIYPQIIFKTKVDDMVAEFYGVDMLICTDTSAQSDLYVIQAAAAGLPLLAARNDFRNDLFTDGEDSFLCDAEDTQGFVQKATKFLNANALRTQFSTNARDLVQNRIEESPAQYYRAYRETIESVLATAPVVNAEVPTTKEQMATVEGEDQSEATANATPTTPQTTMVDGMAMKLPEA